VKEARAHVRGIYAKVLGTGRSEKSN
jgi:hypothetical protein